MTDLANETEVNIPLLRKAVEWVEREAELPWWKRMWYQGTWAALKRDVYSYKERTFKKYEQELDYCGTACCLAGYVVQLNHTVEFEVDEDGDFVDVLVDGSDKLSISDLAREELGLTQVQAAMLFDGGNRASDIRKIAERIAGEPL